MPRPATPCRLFVLLARLAPVGLILRRGPAEWTQLIRWNTRNDTFEPGQWLRGRVDFYKCDLSPSGERFLYFNKAYKPRSIATGYGETWTALSRAPYFTALTLWPMNDTWFGGGVFVDDRMIRLNHPSNAFATHPKHPARDLKIIPEPMWFYVTCVLDERMKRDGWTRRSLTKRVYGGRTIAGEYPQELEKPDPKSRRILVVRDLSDGILHNRPFRFAIIYANTGEEIRAFDATWADWDQHGQLVYAADGKLWRVDFPPRGRAPEIREIADFNANRPDPQPAPEWAHHW
jgi:hypothetical protein